MATYLPNITDVFPEPSLYTPDFNFFDKMLQRKQSMYEQGVSRAKSAFDSVQNAPLSDAANIPIRNEYMKQAREDLKNISSSDFSLPQNVDSARKIFSPFWEDEFILKDASLTKWYQGQAQKLTALRDDTDPKTKGQYNGIAMMYLNNGLDKLKNANRDASKYGQIEKREAVPFTNIQSWLEEAAGKDPDKLKVVWDQQSPDGAYLVQTTNGERSKKKFSTWAESMIGNNFYEQFRVTGIVEKEERLKDFQKQNPNATEQDLTSLMSRDVVSELDRGYKKRNSAIDVELAEINSTLKNMPGTLNEDQKRIVDRLSDDMIMLNGKKAALDEEYKYFNQTDKKRIEDAINNNPSTYFATLAKQRLVDNWATGRAAIEGRDIKENTAFFAAQSAQMRRLEYNETVRINNQSMKEGDWKIWKEKWELEHPTITGTKTTSKDGKTYDAKGNEIVPADGTDPSTGFRYLSLGTTDITGDVNTAATVYNEKMNELFTSAHDLIFDPKGLLHIAKSGLGLTDSEVASLSSAMKNEIRANHDQSSPDYNFTPEQNAAAKKLTKALETNEAVVRSGIKITGPTGLRNALIAYGQDYFNKKMELAKDGNNTILNENEFGAMMSYLTSVQNLDVYNSNEAKRQELIKKVLKNPEYKNIVVDHDGQKDIVSASDMSKDMPTLELQPYGDPDPTHILKLSKEDVASRYIKGELSQTEQGDIFLDGKKYSLTKTNNEEGLIYGPRAWNYIYNDILTTKYGQSEEFAAKVTKANEEVVPDLLYYKTSTGKLGTQWSGTFDKKNQGDKVFNIFNEALSPGNADIYGTDGKPLDTETMGALRALLQNKEENAEKYVQGVTYKTIGVNGKPTISFNLGEIASETKQQIGGVNLDVLNQQEYSLAILPTATGPTLTDLPNSSGMYVYQNLLRGKPMKADPIIAASGFDFTITPNHDGTAGANGQSNVPTAVTVNLSYNVRENVTDPQTKKVVSKVTTKTKDIDIPLTGDKSKSPDEIVNYLYSLYQEVAVSNRTLEQQYEEYLRTNPTNPDGTPTTVSRDDYYKQRGIIIKP
jgi:hypothetical protein